MTLIAELKRRKVFKVGMAYLIAAWLLIQVAATLAPQMNLPSWVPRAITLVLVIGFPIAVVLAWIFEASAHGIHRDASDAAAPLAATPLTTVSAAVPVVTQPPASTEVPCKSIAVLAFADLSPARDQEFFSDGMAEEILNALAKVKALKVAGRTSSFHYKGTNSDLRTIGRELGVAHVLEGSVRKQGDRVRITAQLIQTDDGFHLWSETWDGDLHDVFELQERIARAITGELQVILKGEQQQRLVPVATRNPEAYALYLQASGVFNRREGPRFPEAIVQLQQALRLDPDFARAHARLGALHVLEPIYVPDATDTAMVAAEREAMLAKALDAGLAETHAVLAMVHTMRGHLVESREAFQRALSLDPDDLNANLWAGILYYGDGYLAKACAHFDRVLAVDPLLPNALLWRGIGCFCEGDLERAETLLRRADNVGLAHAGIALHWVCAATGRADEARAQLTRGLTVLSAGMDPAAPGLLAAALWGDTSARAQVIALIDRAEAATGNGRLSAFIPFALLQLGEYRRVLCSFRGDRVNNSTLFFSHLWSPAARAARALPEFGQFARNNGLIELWERYGPPDTGRRIAPGEYVFD